MNRGDAETPREDRITGEERYWEYVAAKASLVHDVDDTRENGYGVYYTKKNPLKKENLKK